MGYNEQELLEAASVVNGEIKPEEMGKLEWIWLALQGDFNQERTAGQIGFDMVVSLIPVVDTIFDVRDLIANLAAYKKDPNSKLTLFFIALTIIGFIPEVGSVIKGVLKIVFLYIRKYIKHIDDITNVGKLTRAMNKVLDSALPKITEVLQNSAVVKWATNNKVANIFKFVADGLNKVVELINPAIFRAALNKAFDTVVDMLGWMYRFLPATPRAYVENSLEIIKNSRQKISDGISEFVEPVRKIMMQTAKRLDDHAKIVSTRMVNKGWISPVSESGAAKLMNARKPAWARMRGETLTHPPIDPAKNLKHKTLVEETIPGWKKKYPNLPELGGNVSTFHTIKPHHYPEGTVLYRVVDPTSGGGGQFWVTKEVFDSLKSRADWREKLAVKPDWNGNGQYVTYTVPKGGLDAYVGKAASQELKDTPYELVGGGEQVFFQPKADTFSTGLARRDKETGDVLPGRGGNPDTRIEWKDVTGEETVSGLRKKINDPNIKGPFETGWGFTDWTPDEAQRLVVVPIVPHDIQ